MNCEYCNNAFTNKANLKIHQKTAKYCIKIQETEKKIFEGKDKLLEEKDKIIFKQESEIKVYINIIKNKDKILEEKEKLIEKLMTMIQPVTVNNTTSTLTSTSNTQKINNIINNLTPITDEHIHEQSKYLNIDYIKKGPIGYVDYALEYPLKNKIVCVDFARKKIKYKNSDGDIVDDPEMVKLSQKFFKAIENANNEILDSYIIKLQDELYTLNFSSSNDMDDEEIKVFDTDSNNILNKAFDAVKYKNEVKKVADGNKPELYYDFVKNICSRVVCNK